MRWLPWIPCARSWCRGLPCRSGLICWAGFPVCRIRVPVCSVREVYHFHIVFLRSTCQADRWRACEANRNCLHSTGNSDGCVVFGSTDYMWKNRTELSDVLPPVRLRICAEPAWNYGTVFWWSVSCCWSNASRSPFRKRLETAACRQGREKEKT